MTDDARGRAASVDERIINLREQAEELARLRKIVQTNRIAIETNVDLTQQVEQQAEELARLRAEITEAEESEAQLAAAVASLARENEALRAAVERGDG